MSSADTSAKAEEAESENSATSAAAPSEPSGKPAGKPLGMRQKLRMFEDLIWDEAHEGQQAVRAFFWRWAQILDLSFRGFREHNCVIRSTALTYTTFLSFIPLLAVVFSILKGLGFQETVAQRILELLEGMAPGSEETMQRTFEQVVNFVDDTKVLGLGGLGGIGLLLTSVSLMSTVERALDSIWSLKKGRPFLRRMTNYVSLLVVAPFLLLLGTSITTVRDAIDPDQWAGRLAPLIESLILNPLWAFVPLISIWAVFVFVYYLFPNTKVRWRSAVWAGLIGGTMWQLAVMLQLQFSVRFMANRYNVIYGGFAWVLMLLVWVYVCWVILLAGAEISCAHQNLQDRRRRKRVWGGTPAEQETLAMRLAALLAKRALQDLGKPFQPVSIDQMADALKLSPAPIGEAMDVFCQTGLAAQVGEDSEYILCRSPNEISDVDVLRLARYGVDQKKFKPGGVLDEFGEKLSQSAGKLKLSDLAEMPLDHVRTFVLPRSEG